MPIARAAPGKSISVSGEKLSLPGSTAERCFSIMQDVLGTSNEHAGRPVLEAFGLDEWRDSRRYPPVLTHVRRLQVCNVVFDLLPTSTWPIV